MSHNRHKNGLIPGTELAFVITKRTCGLARSLA